MEKNDLLTYFKSLDLTPQTREQYIQWTQDHIISRLESCASYLHMLDEAYLRNDHYHDILGQDSCEETRKMVNLMMRVSEAYPKALLNPEVQL